MFNGSRVMTFFHLLIVEGCEDIIQSYIKDIEDSGLYDDCDEFFFNVRFTDINTLNKVLIMCSKYDKFKIVSIVHNDHGFSPYVRRYFIKDIQKFVDQGDRIPMAFRLGEVESIIELMANPSIKRLMDDYDIVLFLNSKSMSHIITTLNPAERIKRRDHECVKAEFKSIFRYKESFECVMNSGKFSSPTKAGGNKMFAFKPEWIRDFTVDEYLQHLRTYSNITNTDDMDLELLRTSSKCLNDNNVAIFKNRHVLCNVPNMINRMMLDGKI